MLRRHPQPQDGAGDTRLLRIYYHAALNRAHNLTYDLGENIQVQSYSSVVV